MTPHEAAETRKDATVQTEVQTANVEVQTSTPTDGLGCAISRRLPPNLRDFRTSARAGGHHDVAALVERAGAVRAKAQRAVAGRSGTIPLAPSATLETADLRRHVWMAGREGRFVNLGEYKSRVRLATKLYSEASAEAAAARHERWTHRVVHEPCASGGDGDGGDGDGGDDGGGMPPAN